jgi:hypothetical protein
MWYFSRTPQTKLRWMFSSLLDTTCFNKNVWCLITIRISKNTWCRNLYIYIYIYTIIVFEDFFIKYWSQKCFFVAFPCEQKCNLRMDNFCYFVHVCRKMNSFWPWLHISNFLTVFDVVKRALSYMSLIIWLTNRKKHPLLTSLGF